MPLESLPKDYPCFLHDLKERIRAARLKVALSANRELVILYWDLGRRVTQQQKRGRWGTGVLAQISRDLRAEFPEMKGFSVQNIRHMRAFFLAWMARAPIRSQAASGLSAPILQQPAGELEVPILSQPVRELPEPLAEIPWFHNVILLMKLKDPQIRLWYARKTVKHGWSRPVLTHQIETGLHLRQGKALTNFERTLPSPQSELAREAIKNDYNLDLAIPEGAKERDIERALVEDIRRSMMELGTGFAFVGNQYHLEVGGEDFYIDLLFYHLKLRCYVVIELKTDAFKPEHAGKLGFYLAAVDKLMRHADDQPSIGLVLCKSNNKVIAEYALRNMTKPMSVATYRLTKALPAALAKRLPTTKELEEKFQGSRLPD